MDVELVGFIHLLLCAGVPTHVSQMPTFLCTWLVLRHTFTNRSIDILINEDSGETEFFFPHGTFHKTDKQKEVMNLL